MEDQFLSLIYPLYTLCFLLFFKELFLSFCEDADVPNPVFPHAAKCFSLSAGDESLFLHIAKKKKEQSHM